MVNVNNVTGSPVGVTIADNIKMNINSSGLLVVKKWIFNKFLFKRNNDNIFAKAFKRIDGNFIEVGNVVGRKTSSFILFEDNSINKNLDFAWHLDEVTKNLKPYILSKKNNELINLPDEQSCISKNFWY